MFSFVLSSTAQLYQSLKIVSIRSASMLTIAHNLGYLMTVVIQLMKTKVCYCYECIKKKIITYLYTCWLCLLFLYKLYLDIEYFSLMALILQHSVKLHMYQGREQQ